MADPNCLQFVLGGGTYAIYASGNSGGSTGTTHVGLDTAGGNTETTAANYFETVKATPSQNISVTSLNLYVASGATEAVNLGLYSDNGGIPGTKLAEVPTVTLENGWNTGAIPATNLTAGTVLAYF